MREELTIDVENRCGELARIAGLVAARGLNVDTLTLTETDDPRVSRITLSVFTDERTIHLLMKQLERQVRVHSVARGNRTLNAQNQTLNAER